MVNLAHSASFHSMEKTAPTKLGIKHLANGQRPRKLLFGQLLRKGFWGARKTSRPSGAPDEHPASSLRNICGAGHGDDAAQPLVLIFVSSESRLRLVKALAAETNESRMFAN
ncbi:hypothetical protein [Aureimonas sp. SA4125]|uniref:hypothetical protein n=1 Tax=Aureimonas sp. SA4125 TaxID=2826993 RepID=UPI001CC5F5DC|nr:hypothetical protein [Aureimonas sp. SA4125]